MSTIVGTTVVPIEKDVEMSRLNEEKHKDDNHDSDKHKDNSPKHRKDSD